MTPNTSPNKLFKVIYSNKDTNPIAHIYKFFTLDEAQSTQWHSNLQGAATSELLPTWFGPLASYDVMYYYNQTILTEQEALDLYPEEFI